MEWINNLFKKTSNILTVTVYGDCEDSCTNISANCKTKILSHIKKDPLFSISSLVHAKNSDLTIFINSTSYLRKEGTEILYFEEDLESKKLVLKLKKLFKDASLGNADNFISLKYLKSLKRKIIIKPSKEDSSLIVKFLEGI